MSTREHDTTISAYVSGVQLRKVMYLNADQLALAFHAANEPRAAAIVMEYAEKIRASIK